MARRSAHSAEWLVRPGTSGQSNGPLSPGHTWPLVRKILNDPARFVTEMLEGILAAHAERLRTAGEPRAIVRADAPVTGKVAIATGGGSGHLPLFMGYVGDGLLDGAAIGGVFQSPSSAQMLNVTKAIDGGAGVLYLYGNYGGDVLNFDMA